MREEVEKSLEKIREFLKMDGGDVELVDVSDDGVVKVRLLGARSQLGRCRCVSRRP